MSVVKRTMRTKTMRTFGCRLIHSDNGKMRQVPNSRQVFGWINLSEVAFLHVCFDSALVLFTIDNQRNGLETQAKALMLLT